ncbi:amino acid adenylation domain-containing protein [Streptomyces gamaensis]|uniref:Amino acid adenylation domain-containing protein n=1 Tax=Streptomyces gamaensis TaxID=1763542 RepID=A0ABW0YWK7_9ACTN
MPYTAPTPAKDAPMDRSHLTDMPSLVAHYARHTPDALAVADGDTALTYNQLDVFSRQLAAHLREQGVRPGDRVALLMPRSARTVVAQLALWRAGAACVPLDPAHPRARTEAMLAGSGAGLTLGDSKLLEAAEGLGACLALPEAPLPAFPGIPEAAPGPDATALVLFTSGSTGTPKGVALTHGAVARMASDASCITVTARDRVLLHSPATFDASTFETWAPLARGAAVMVCPVARPSLEDLARQVERQGVTVAFFTTALFHQLAARRSRLFSVLRTVVVGGETLSPRHARAVLREFPWIQLVNGYGPTEATTFATTHRVTDADCDGPVPIGRPVAGATARVLGQDGQPVPAGERGELWVGGGRLATGYRGQPELTAERFVDHPVYGRLYRTGDVVSVRPDGVLDFHGRTDDQVKVRGFRIEPGEIEHALRTQPEVDDAAVTVRRPTPDDARLAAFVVAAPGPVPRAHTLRSRLAGLLPAHLVPDEITVVERLPLTPSGKVDRRALAEGRAGGTARTGLRPEEARRAAAPTTPARPATTGPETPQAAPPPAPATAGPGSPLSPLQQVVAGIWSRALGRDVSSPDDDFLALGGHSLLALGIADDLREDLGVELSLADFFATPTVAAHAALVERALLAVHSDPRPTSEDSDGH